jgi:hypothetical protein
MIKKEYHKTKENTIARQGACRQGGQGNGTFEPKVRGA